MCDRTSSVVAAISCSQLTQLVVFTSCGRCTKGGGQVVQVTVLEVHRCAKAGEPRAEGETPPKGQHHLQQELGLSLESPPGLPWDVGAGHQLKGS